MQVQSGRSLEERCARYDQSVVPELYTRYHVSGDARLGFELEAHNPRALLSSLPSLGVLDMVRACVAYDGPALFGLLVDEHYTFRTICRRTLDSTQWTSVYTSEKSICYVHSTGRNRAVFCEAYNTADPTTHFAIDTNNVVSINLEYKWPCVGEHMENVNYSQTLLMSSHYTGFYDLHGKRIFRGVTWDDLSARFVQVLAGDKCVRFNLNFGYKCLQTLDLHSDSRTWRNEPPTKFDTSSIRELSQAVSDRDGNNYYIVAKTDDHAVLLHKDMRDSTPLRAISTAQFEYHTYCWYLLAYNGGNDLFYTDSMHFSVRARRWTHGLTSLNSAVDRNIYPLAVLDEPP
jgi:hypothetical protein